MKSSFKKLALAFSMLALMAVNVMAQRPPAQQPNFTFYFLPPNEDIWILGTPYLEIDGEATVMKADPNSCGWYYWSGEEPPTSALIQLGPGITSEQIGTLGVDEPLPTRFNLAEQFETLLGKDDNGDIKRDTIYFVADSGAAGWKAEEPYIDEPKRCFYNFAAIIYDTDGSVNKSFFNGTNNPITNGFSYGVRKNIPQDTLAPDSLGVPKMQWGGKTGNAAAGWTEENFIDAFKSTPGKNVVRCYDMPFKRNLSSLWEFDSNKLCNDDSMDLNGTCANGGGYVGGYFPNELQTRGKADYSECETCDSTYRANDFNDNRIDKKKNFSFCFESTPATFIYEKGQKFFFRGDDDIWVFINDSLVIDIGGIHPASADSVSLDNLGLTEGKEYPINIFFCERQVTQSNVRIATNIYFSQNTGLFVNGNAETSDAPICLSKSGGGDCGVAMGIEGSGFSQECGKDITNNLHYYMQRRNGDRTGLDLDPDNNPTHCAREGDIIKCYGGITINTDSGTVHVNKTAITKYGGGLSGTYFIYVEAKDPNLWQPTPPPRQVTRFSMASSIFAIWGDIRYESGGAVPGLPAKLRSVRNGEQSTLAGKLVPIAFADGGWDDDSKSIFSVSDATELSLSISRAGLTNEDGTAEIQIYMDEAGTIPVSLNESIDIPDSNRVLVLWVTGNYESSEEFTYEVNVQGSSQDPHKIKVRLPKLEFVNSKTNPATTIIPRSKAFGSNPSRGTTPQERQVYMGEGLERIVAAFDPLDTTLCITCNFKISVNACVTKDPFPTQNPSCIETGAKDNSVLRADAAEIVNGVGELTFRGVAQLEGPNAIDSAYAYYATLSVRGPSTLDSTKAFWDYMMFTKPPVPTPIAVEIFDQNGDGKGDSLRIAYDRKFSNRPGTDSVPPNAIQVLWDPSMKDTIKIGLGVLDSGKYMLKANAEENWNFWKNGEQNNFKISMERDSIIVITGKVVGTDELGREIHASFSEGVKTSKGLGSVVVRNWATYRDKGGIPTTTPFDAEIRDKIPAIVVSAIFNPGNCNRNAGPCDDQIILTLSEQVKKVKEGVGDNRGSLPSLATPFQYRLERYKEEISKYKWDTYTNERDLPAIRNTKSNIVWRPSTAQVEPDAIRDSIVTIMYRYSPDANTPLRGDSVKFASGSNASLMDLEGNHPNPKEWGRRFVGEITITTGKVPIGEVDPELCSDQGPGAAEDCRQQIANKIINANQDFTNKQKYKISKDLFANGVTDYLPVPEGWDAKKVAEQYPGTVGIIIRPDVASKGVKPEQISFYSSAYYHTNLGNYVVETAPLRELKCTDDIFNGDCTSGNGMGVYLAWNMRDAKDRWAGAGAYVEVYDFYWKIEGSDEKDGTFDKMSKKIEMLGVKRTKKKK